MEYSTRIDAAFDDPSVEGVVGPHGLDVDDKGRLWYAGKSSDTLGYYDITTMSIRVFLRDEIEFCTKLH